MAAFLVLWSSGASYAGPRDDAMAVIDKWVQAFGASDVDGITRLYAPDALFMGTGSRTVVTDPAGVRRYFEQALLHSSLDPPRCSSPRPWSCPTPSSW